MQSIGGQFGHDVELQHETCVDRKAYGLYHGRGASGNRGSSIQRRLHIRKARTTSRVVGEVVNKVTVGSISSIVRSELLIRKNEIGPIGCDGRGVGTVHG